MAAYHYLRRALNEIVELMLRALQAQQNSVINRVHTPFDYQIVELRKKTFEDAVDRLLYQAMTTSELLSEENKRKLNLPTKWLDLAGYFNAFYDDLIVLSARVKRLRKAEHAYFALLREQHIDITDHDGRVGYYLSTRNFSEFQDVLRTVENTLSKRNAQLPPLLSDFALPEPTSPIDEPYLHWPHNEHAKWEFAFDLIGLEQFVFRNVTQLIDALRWHPCRAQVGQLEAIPEPRRLYSDVELEITNQLTNLRRFQAKCKLESNVGIENFDLVTQKLEALSVPSVATRIKELSQHRYTGRPMKAKPFGTIKYDKPSIDEDSIQFGEKKTAS